MKSISASIVIATGLATFALGGMIRADNALAVAGVGAIVAVLGIIFWIRTLNQP